MGIFFIIWGFINIGKSVKYCDKNGRRLYNVFIVICLINFVYGIPELYQSGRINELFANNQTSWMYLIGLAFLIPANTKYITQIINWAFLYALTSLLFSLYFFTDFYIDAERIILSMIGWDAYVLNRPQEPSMMLVPIAAFLVFYRYYPKIWKYILLIAMPMALIASSMAGRRTATISLIGYLIIAFYLHIAKQKSRLANLIIIIFLGSFVFVESGGLNSIGSYFEKNFVIMNERMDVDSRSNVEYEFYKDMKEPVDWIFGRGMAGTYKSLELSQINKLNRSIIETGYLNVILHGGLLMLIPYVILLLYSFVMGFFRSHSYFVKSCALFVIYHFILLYPGGHLRLTLEFLILFIFMRICLSSSWRSKSDTEIMQSINLSNTNYSNK